MKAKLTMAGIGAFFIGVAIYFFPFGQDIVILTLTNMTGSQVNAWLTMYVICFALLFTGIVMGGMGRTGTRKLIRLWRMLTKNPLLLIAVLVIGYIIFTKFTGMW